MKKFAYYLIPISMLLVSCNAGSNGNSSNQTTNSHVPYESSIVQPTVKSIPLNPAQYSGNIILTINNLFNGTISETVPDSDHLTCLPSNTNCGYSNSDLFTAFGPNSSITLTLQSDTSFGTISLEVDGNGKPLFSLWQDGAGTPNPNNHYNGSFPVTTEVPNWTVGNNPSLFIGVPSTNENSSWTIDQNNNVNITINIDYF